MEKQGFLAGLASILVLLPIHCASARLWCPSPACAGSYVRIRRVNDGVERVSEGNLNDNPPTKERRDYVFTVQAPASYEITIVPPTARPSWAPDGLTLGFRDGPDGGCFKSVDVVLMPPPTGSWFLPETDQQAWK